MSDGFLKTDAGKGYAFFGRDYSEAKYFGDGAGIGVRQGEEGLRDGFSAAIQAIRDSGEYKEINDNYFEVDIFGG
jgi:ABC-type amino acid transport substrate-binding protein